MRVTRLFRLSRCLLMLVLAVATPRLAGAWAAVGHQTVAYIAQDHLTSNTSQQVRAILGANGDLAAVAKWADDIKHTSRPATAPWHYIDLPVRTNVTLTSIGQYCITNDLLDQVNLDMAALKAATASDTNRLETLKFLVHFAGDLSMPLHCSDDGDTGGNDKKVRFYGPSGLRPLGTKTDLHSLWDHLIEIKTTEDPRQLATDLESHISQSQIADWCKGSPEDWAMESYGIAKQVIYTNFAAGATPTGTVVKLSRRYYSNVRPIVDVQLERAGIRLAHILNSIYDPASANHP